MECVVPFVLVDMNAIVGRGVHLAGRGPVGIKPIRTRSGLKRKFRRKNDLLWCAFCGQFAMQSLLYNPALGSQPMHYRLIEKQIVYRGKKIQVEVDRLENQETGRELKREVCIHPGAVVILPVMQDGRVLMISNHRY